MTNRNQSNESLERVCGQISRAAGLPENEIDEISSRAFAFARLQARIEGEKENRQRAPWMMFWLTSKKAIPAMVLVAALSVGLSVYVGNKTANSAFSVDAYLGTNESGIENTFFAEGRPLTRDEVLATIITANEREGAR